MIKRVVNANKIYDNYSTQNFEDLRMNLELQNKNIQEVENDLDIILERYQKRNNKIKSDP